MKRIALEPNRIAHPSAGDLAGKKARQSTSAQTLASGTSGSAKPGALRAEPPSDGETHAVSFKLSKPEASQVYLAGTFNNWSPRANPLTIQPDGKWTTRLMLHPGRYEYCFIVDGKWQSDPRSKMQVANPFGGLNSVVEVKMLQQAA